MNTIISPTIIPVTGREEQIDPREPLGALCEFYQAFNTRDLPMMERNWVRSEEASMAHPLGGIRRGWSDIREVYERIFNATANLNMELRDYTVHLLGGAFYAVGREHGLLQGADLSLELKFRTSRLFRYSRGRWRQVHHHGSIENPELLLRYQAAIR
jgi:hypothetical protein